MELGPDFFEKMKVPAVVAGMLERKEEYKVNREAEDRLLLDNVQPSVVRGGPEHRDFDKVLNAASEMVFSSASDLMTPSSVPFDAPSVGEGARESAASEDGNTTPTVIIKTEPDLKEE